MAISEVGICNLALLEVGAKPPIQLLSENTENGRHCLRLYPVMRDAVLRSFPWNCAIHRRTITEMTATPDSGYDCQYQWPVNPYCLRVLQVGEVGDDIEWRPEGRRILTNEGTSIKLVYIKRITDTNEFDPNLVDALCLKIASRLAIPLANSPKLKEHLEAAYDDVISEARTIDGQESSGDEVEPIDFVNSRH